MFNTMKIVNIIGGLGNQMFVYATYLSLKKQHPAETIKICIKSFNGYHLHNGYEINKIFNTNDITANLGDLVKVAYPFFNYRTWQIMTHLLPMRSCMVKCTEHTPFNFDDILRSSNCYYDGYWQNEKYFISARTEILKAFQFPSFRNKINIDLSNKIKMTNSVACHIRRGDYLKDKRWNVCTIEYYRKAIATLKEGIDPEMFCVFSDDIEWCRATLGTNFSGVDTVYVDWNKKDESYRDMQLMSLCKHNIVANSSFSWWGAWLNKNPGKIVITPNQWMTEPWENSPVPDSWIKIKVG